MSTPIRHRQLRAASRLIAGTAMAALMAMPLVADAHAGAASTQTFPTPQAMASGLKSAGQTATSIATQLAQTFTQNAQQVATLLKNVGFTARQIAEAIRTAFKASLDANANALKAAGFTLTQATDALLPLATPAQVAQAAKSTYNASAAQMVAALKAANVSADDMIAVLLVYGQGSCNAQTCPAAQLLRQGGYQAHQTGSALKTVLMLSIQVVAHVLRTVYGLSDQALETALVSAGFAANAAAGVVQATAKTVGTVANAAVTTATTAGANAIELATAIHGDYRNCSFPAHTTLFGPRWSPLPLPAGARHTVTLVGRGLALVTNISGWPAGAMATIRQRHDCYLVVDVTMPRGAREGTQGFATLQVGQSAGPRVSWVIGPVPPPQTGRVSVGRGVAAPAVQPVTAAQVPDLVGTLVGPLLRFSQPGSRRIDDRFCQSVPVPPIGQASIAEITVEPLRWGVINSSNASVTTGFRIELANHATGQVLSTADVPPGRLVPGVSRFDATYARPQSRTRVIRISPTSNNQILSQYGSAGCFQLLMAPGDPLNWQDPPLRVRVDVTNAVNEGPDGEINNQSVH